MPNGRCRIHGGKSTGARTPEGLERCRKAGWKHGKRDAPTREQAAQRGAARRLRGVLLKLAAQVEAVDQK